MKKVISVILSLFVAFSLTVNVYAYNYDKQMLESYKSEYSIGRSKSILNMINKEIVKRITNNINPEWTIEQKIAYIYSYISNQSRHTGNENGTYGVLFRGCSDCNNFSDTFNDVCEAVGIESKSVNGCGINGSYISHHSINVVNVNGKWYEIDCDGGRFLRGGDNSAYNKELPTVEAESPYISARGARFFEYNKQWYAYSPDGIYTVSSDFQKKSATLVYEFDDWCPSSTVYDNNGKLYFDWKKEIRVYDAATNTVSTAAKLNSDLAFSLEPKYISGRTTNLNAPFSWFGIDKYALMYVTSEGKCGSLGSSKKLELTSYKKNINVNECTFVTSMSSTEYKCGTQVKYSTKDTDIISIDEFGVVYGLKPGKATVTVSAFGRSNTYTVNVRYHQSDSDGVPALKL